MSGRVSYCSFGMVCFSTEESGGRALELGPMEVTYSRRGIRISLGRWERAPQRFARITNIQTPCPHDAIMEQARKHHLEVEMESSLTLKSLRLYLIAM